MSTGITHQKATAYSTFSRRLWSVIAKANKVDSWGVDSGKHML